MQLKYGHMQHVKFIALAQFLVQFAIGDTTLKYSDIQGVAKKK